MRLSREIADMWTLAEACRHLGQVVRSNQDLAGAARWFAESLAAAHTANSPWNIVWTQLNIGMTAEATGEYIDAIRLYEACLPVFYRLGNAVGVGITVMRYSGALLSLGELDRAAKLLDDTLASDRFDWGSSEIMHLHHQRGQVAYAQADFGRASQHFVQALRFELEANQQFPHGDYLVMLQELLTEIAMVATAQGQHVHATRLFSQVRACVSYNMPDQVQDQFRASLAACRAALGDAAFDAAWAAGQALTLEQAVAEALDINGALDDGE